MKLLATAQGESSLYLGKKYATGPFVAFSLLLVLFFSCSKGKGSSSNKEIQIKEIDTQLVERTAQKTNTSAQAKEYYNQGVLYQEQGMQEKAIKEFKEAIQLRPDYAEAYNNIGTSYQFLGKYDKAIQSYRKSVEVQPDLIEGYHSSCYSPSWLNWLKQANLIRFWSATIIIPLA